MADTDSQPLTLRRILLVIATGVGAGFLSGLFGVGGGLVIVPALMAVLGMDQRRASATSLAAIIVTAAVGSGNYALHGEVSWAGGALLVVSQFTLYADLSSRRPGFSKAAKPAIAEPLYESFMAHCRELGFAVEHGSFGADMQVASVNDGPVTLLFDTE